MSRFTIPTSLRRNACGRAPGTSSRSRIVTAVVLFAAIAATVTVISVGFCQKSAVQPAGYVKKATARETFDAAMNADGVRSLKLGPWYCLGPFDNKDGAGFEAVYEPETKIDLSATYTGRDGEKLQWAKRMDFADGRSNDLRIYQNSDNMIVYLYREITAERDVVVDADLGSDDGIVFWLNGERLLSKKVSRGCNLGDDTVQLKLRPGVNKILMKIWQGGGGAGFAFAIKKSNKLLDQTLDQISNDFSPAESWQLQIDMDYEKEFGVLAGQVARRESINRFASTTLNPAALIADTDRDPADVVIRRTGALLADLSASSTKPVWAEFKADLAKLQTRCEKTSADDSAARFDLYMDACRLRRKIAFSNPLLNFDKLLFVKHTRCGPNEALGNHMCDQYFGFKATTGGGVYILENPFGGTPKLVDVLKNSTVKAGRLAGQKLSDKGSFISPELSYDAKTIYFAYTEQGQGDAWSPQKSYHIFKVGVDGSNLAQLVDGPWNEFDPCCLPNGEIVFISERRGGYGRCHGRPVPVYTLHRMKSDGSDLRCLSYHESNEWHPSVANDGMIVYSRWDYVDRGFNQAHHPWITTPDGRDARAFHGNYPDRLQSRPWLEMNVKPIPDSRKFVATAAPHHGQAYGSLVLIDPSVEDDGGMSQVRRITPDAAFPEGEDNGRYPYGMVYGSSWPLSEKYVLCAYDPESNIHGIYLVDAFGNREMIYRDRTTGSLGPIPLRTRPKPPIIPDMLKAEAGDTKEATGTIAVMNVYDALRPWPKDTKITALRIMQVLPKSTPYANNPRIGYGDQKSARTILGTVPVEADGSANFTVPAGRAIYFQALDSRGLAIQSMRSDTYVHPGERLVCQGCHNRRVSAPPAPKYPVAMQRPPSAIKPEVDGTNPFNYPRLVQPILDKHCVSCHQPGKSAPDLTASDGRQGGWSTSYVNLRNYAFFFDGAAETTSVTIPGAFGAEASRLYDMLTKGHYDVKLPEPEMHRLTLWLDSNSDFFGAYEETERQARGEIVKPSIN